MRITQISYTGFGGLGSVVFSLMAADQTHQHNWSIGFIGDLSLDAAYPVLCDAHQADYAAFQSLPGKPYRAWGALARWLDTVKPDVVICHSINSILACRWYASRHGARLIAVEHTANHVKTRSEWAASRVSMAVANRVVVLTEDYREELRKAHGWLYRPKKVRVIPNGIDTLLFSPGLKRSQTSDKRIRLGMAARFSFSKRQDFLIDVLSKLANLRPDLTFELRFAGNGEEFDRVKALTSNSPLAPHIHFDGLLIESQVAEWLKDLDIYVHATAGESFCLAVLQAMATGLPVIASANVGIAVLSKTGSDGVLVVNDAHLWARALAHLADNVELRKNMGRLARKRAVALYDSTASLNEYLQVISE